MPKRVLAWAERRGVRTLGELAAIPRRELLAEPGLGRRSVRDARVLLEQRLGRRWGALARTSALGAVPFEAASDWDTLRARIPDDLRAAPLSEIALPARVKGYAAREGLVTVADLATRSKATLVSAKNSGNKSVTALVAALKAHRGRLAALRALADLGLFAGWKAVLLDLDAAARQVLTLRSGLGGRVEKLRTLGKMLGVTGERARQIEAGAVDALRAKGSFVRAARERFEAALTRGGCPLEELEKDPWWSGATALPGAVEYFAERVLDGVAHVVEARKRKWLARADQQAVDEAWSALRRGVASLRAPAPLAEVEALCEVHRPALGDALVSALFDRLQDRLHVDSRGDERVVVAIGDSSVAATIVLLSESPTPLPTADVRALTGKAALPEEVLFFSGGRIGLEKHFPDFDRLVRELVPRAVDVMRREGPDRQWLASELLAALRASSAVPPWLDRWHMSSLLRRSGKVRYLGRMRVALPDATSSGERVHIHTALVGILRANGGPMHHDELVARLHAMTGTSDLTLKQALQCAPVFRIDEHRHGLLDRDVPGAPSALVDARDYVAALLARRRRGLGAVPLAAKIARLSADHARWGPQTCLAVLRTDARFRVSVAGAVGLATWDDVRVPSRVDLVRRCLEESGGKVSVEAVEASIQALYGMRPTRSTIAGMAHQVGAAIRGEWVERVARG
jgi:hypothetical protein